MHIVFPLLCNQHVTADTDGFTFRMQGVGPIHMDNVQCAGSESRLSDCPHTSQHNCEHNEDAGVTCQQRKYFMFAERAFSMQIRGLAEYLCKKRSLYVL